jgi:ATP-dependent helicase HrpB
MAALPMAPPLAHMLLYAAQHGAARDAALLALLLQERGLGGRGEDLAARLDRWKGERGTRAEASRKLAARWERRAVELAGASNGESPPLGVLLAEAYPDNIARRRDASGEHWLTAGGRGLRLDPASSLARAEWLSVGEAQGEAKGARITGAIALDEAEVTRWLAHRIERRAALRWIADEGRVEALLEARLGAITLSKGSDPAPDPLAIRDFLLAKVQEEGLGLIPLSKASLNLLKRARFAGIPALADEAVLVDAADWLGPLLTRRLDQLDPGKMHEALRARLDYAAQQALEKLAPPQFTSPAGTAHAIDYDDPGGPSVELRVQALFGLDRHPTFGQPPQPLLLKLTDPGGKPAQTTRDLPAFWRGSWRDVVRDLKGRYPKHRWPDEPWNEIASLKTKNAFNRT